MGYFSLVSLSINLLNLDKCEQRGYKSGNSYIIFVASMKKMLAAILMIVYLAFSSGVVINHHFCMNRLASVSLFGTDSEYCGKCGMHADDSEGCCHDEVEVVKLDNDHQKSQVAALNPPEIITLSVLASAFICLPAQNADPTGHYHNHSPPLLSAQDTYLQINVFRI